MGFFSSLFGKNNSNNDLIVKVKDFLNPQISFLEEKHPGYEDLLGQRGVYYIYCLANNIANRKIDNDEFKELLINVFGSETGYSLFAIYSMTADHHDVNSEMIKMLMPLAKKDIENDVSNSNGFLVNYYKYAQEKLNKSFNEPFVPLSPEEAMEKANKVDENFKQAFGL